VGISVHLGSGTHERSIVQCCGACTQGQHPQNPGIHNASSGAVAAPLLVHGWWCGCGDSVRDEIYGLLGVFSGWSVLRWLSPLLAPQLVALVISGSPRLAVDVPLSS